MDNNAHPTSILILDPDLISQRILSHYFSPADTVTGAAGALDLLAQVPYRALIVECRLPALDGVEPVRRLRTSADCLTRNLYVMGITVDPLRFSRRTCLGAGMDDYLIKPIRPQEYTQAQRRFQAATSKATALAD